LGDIFLLEGERSEIIYILDQAMGRSATIKGVKKYARDAALRKNKQLGRNDISQRRVVNLILNDQQIMDHEIFKRDPEIVKKLSPGKGRVAATQGQQQDEYRRKHGRERRDINKRRGGRRG